MDYFVIDTHRIEAPTPPARQHRQSGGDGASLGPEFERRFRRVLKARYDAAGLSPEMENWWSNADAMSPRASVNASIRKRIRERARYEFVQSGCIAVGMLEALTNSVIGCGPTLQLQTTDKELNRLVEDEWHAFAKAIRLRQKLRTMFAAKVVDGEAFAQKIRNPRLETPVKFDIRLTESDLWTNPLADRILDPNEDDGVYHDSAGNPLSYRRLRHHPGDDQFVAANPWATDDIPAQFVIHWFKTFRPDQRRGVSEVAPSLRPLAELRRYKMAVQAAMETAANHAGIMFSSASAYSESPAIIDEDDIFANVSVPRNSLLTLPEGWDMKQLKAEQPTTHYIEFVEERIAAAARPLQMPLNIAMGSSRNHNFASAKLDYTQYAMANGPRRKDCDDAVLDRLFDWWLFEARGVPDYLPPLKAYFAEDRSRAMSRAWQWPRTEPVDIVAQAKADTLYFNIGWLTDEHYCKRESLDIDEMAEQWKRQTERRDAAGESFPQPGVSMSEQIMNEDALQPAGADDE